jgi:hypothetical protein
MARPVDTVQPPVNGVPRRRDGHERIHHMNEVQVTAESNRKVTLLDPLLATRLPEQPRRGPLNPGEKPPHPGDVLGFGTKARRALKQEPSRIQHFCAFQ